MLDVGNLNVVYADPEAEEVRQALNLLCLKGVFAHETASNYLNKWLNSLPDYRLGGIRLEARLCEISAEIDELLSSGLNQLKKRTRGVELHGRLEKIRDQLENRPQEEHLRVQLSRMASTLLKEIFYLEPERT